MNNVGKPALYGLTHPTVGTFFLVNHLSILKPGKTNTVSIADNQWISEQTKTEVENLAKFSKFLQELLMIIDE
jgi:hypothetical protein